MEDLQNLTRKRTSCSDFYLDDISESNNEDVIDAEFEDKDVPPDVSESNKETA